MLIDANILLAATVRRDPRHARANAWLVDAMTSGQRIALPYQCIGAFVRVGTNPRLADHFRMTLEQAWRRVDTWLAAPNVWVPTAGKETVRLLGELLDRHQIVGPLVSDAQLAAVAWEHSIPVVSSDTDFAKFPEITWINPLR